MGTILASVLVDRVLELLQDEKGIVWTSGQVLGWLNDAQIHIHAERPDASVDNHSLKMIKGTRQLSPGTRLMGVTRNMGVDGLTPGSAIRLVERGIKDDFSPDWHNDAASLIVKEYVYDARSPDELYVWPPVDDSADVYIEVLETVVPASIPSSSDPITLDDTYSAIMVEWALYRCLSRDSEENPNFQRAEQHHQNFFNMLGVKLKPDMSINPKVRSQLK